MSRPHSGSVNAATRPSGTRWVHEIKHAGCRLIVRRDGGRVRLRSVRAGDMGPTGLMMTATEIRVSVGKIL
jgi:ATP-dependent DNA ligase